MAPRVAVKVEGAKELRKAFKQAGDKDLLNALKAANKSAAQLVVEKALPAVPVRSGRLKASVRATATQRQGVARAGRSSVPYGAAIHWGRKRGNVGSPPGNRIAANPIRGRPFLWNAAQRGRQLVVEQYGTQIQHVLDGITRGR